MTVVLCDDHVMFLEALTHALEARGQKVLATAADPRDVIDVLRREQPRVCVLDVSFEGSSGIVAAQRIRGELPGIAIMLLTGNGDDAVWAAFDSRLVDAVVSKTCTIEVIESAIQRVGAGARVVEGWRRTLPDQRNLDNMDLLTRRERETLDLIVQGCDTLAMAHKLGVSENTVRTHVQSVLRKLNVHRRTKAAQIAVANRRRVTRTAYPSSSPDVPLL